MTDRQILDALAYKNQWELAIGFLRYEARRKLKPREFEALHKRNSAGENFDKMVDELVRKQ